MLYKQQYSMKTLKLTSRPLINRIDRLDNKITELFYDGEDINKLSDRVVIAVVGSRKLSPYGKHVTEDITKKLASAGVIIVSGLAFGADITAHKSCLEAGGITWSVLPSDLENIYPASHRGIAKSIVKNGGTLLTEHPSKHIPMRHDFLLRNRIIAALSDAVVITEATKQSGSLNTARHAKAMNIPVFAVPGPINNDLSSGTNLLIKNGARILTEVEDIFEILDIKPASEKVNKFSADSIENEILKCISNGINTPALLSRELNMDFIDIQSKLTMLEIDGLVSQDSTGNLILV